MGRFGMVVEVMVLVCLSGFVELKIWLRNSMETPIATRDLVFPRNPRTGPYYPRIVSSQQQFHLFVQFDPLGRNVTPPAISSIRFAAILKKQINQTNLFSPSKLALTTETALATPLYLCWTACLHDSLCKCGDF